MIEIGKPYVVRVDDTSRLCSDITVRGETRTLWIGVDKKYEECLTTERVDPFLVIILPLAMMIGGEEIVCREVISAKLYFGITEYLVPTLVRKKGKFRNVSIRGKTTEKINPAVNVGRNVCGMGFSGGVDCLYSIMRHGKDSLYPVTHLAVFNCGFFWGNRQANFSEACKRCSRFAAALSLETVFVDSNIMDVLQERFLDVYSFRNLGFALALQGLFSTYLLSSGHDAAAFTLDLDNSATYDMLTVNSVCTENLTFYLSGAETTRAGKMAELAEWEPAPNWMHPCIYGFAGGVNCGKCKKCIRDMTSLYCMGKLDVFKNVFNVEEYHHNKAQKMAFVLANKGNHLYDETISLMEKHRELVPAAAFRLAEIFSDTIENLKKKDGQ